MALHGPTLNVARGPTVSPAPSETPQARADRLATVTVTATTCRAVNDRWAIDAVSTVVAAGQSSKATWTDLVVVALLAWAAPAEVGATTAVATSIRTDRRMTLGPAVLRTVIMTLAVSKWFGP